MRLGWTTRIALALLIGVILGVTIYAFPSWSGFVTVLFRGAAIVGVLALLMVLIAVSTKRRPGRLDLIFLLAAIGLVAFSWPQLSATADADQLAAAIEEAGESDVLTVLAETETDTGALVREALTLREETDAEVDAVIAGLWDPAFLEVITGPEAEDAEALATTAEAVDNSIAGIEDARETVEALFDAEIDAIPEIDTTLPDSARLTFVDAAIAEVDDHYLAAIERLNQIEARLLAVAEALSALARSAGSYRYDGAAETVVFESGGGALLSDAAATYSVALTNVTLSLEAEESIIAATNDQAARSASALRLVEAASTQP